MRETFLEKMMLEDGALFCSMPFFKNLKINFKGVLSYMLDLTGYTRKCLRTLL